MMSDPWAARLSDYLDGELTDAERSALERHLGACPSCTAALDELARVVERARRMPARAPSTDLWPGIAARIGVEAPMPAMAPLPKSRRWNFSLPQLAAACLAAAAISGGGVWLAAGRALGPAGPLPAAPRPVAVSPVAPLALPAGQPAAAEQKYDAAVADLQRVLEQGRGTLDTTTVRVLERNLAVIDRAIADARRALAADPSNSYLNAHLARTMRRKIDLLRQAADLVAARS
jgi:anti-sigma factor RsiW